ncbi:1241_t:CDS:2, partial [Acaulospora colombiana]
LGVSNKYLTQVSSSLLLELGRSPNTDTSNPMTLTVVMTFYRVRYAPRRGVPNQAKVQTAIHIEH